MRRCSRWVRLERAHPVFIMRLHIFPPFFFSLFLIAWTPAQADLILPTIDSDEISKATGVYPDSRSTADLNSRSSYLLNTLLEIARDQKQKGNLVDSLTAYQAAMKLDREFNNGNFFNGNLELGYLYGEMNRWIDAKRVFDRAVRTRWQIREAADIIDFCLKHKQTNLAYSYRNPLILAVEDPDATLTYSKLLAAIKDKGGALEAARRAYYLAVAKGGDPLKAKENLSSLTSTISEPIPDKSFESEFWKRVDQMVSLPDFPQPSNVQPLVDPPVFVHGSIGDKKNIVVVGYQSDALKGAVRRAALLCDQEYHVIGIMLEPNILSCNLSKEDVHAHLNQAGKSQIPTSLEKDNENEELENYHVKLDQRVVQYGFQKKGFGTLVNVSIYWKTKGAKLIKVREFPPPPPWTMYFNDASEDLRKRRYKECRRNLCRAFVYWDFNRFSKVGISFDTKRKEYESFKKCFFDLYTAWGKSEIAEYITLVSFPQFQQEIMQLDSELITELPTAAEFRHSVWKLTRLDPDWFSIEIKNMGIKSAYKDSPLHTYFATIYGDGPKAEEIEIYAPPAKIIDDEIFKEGSTF